ncbi:MAG: hypothetical protein QW046_05910 [Candidatus Micrarchaeaceae archaeon]
MSSESLAGLHQAMHTMDQLRIDIVKQTAKLKQIQSDELKDTFKKVNELIGATYWIAASITALLEVYYNMLLPEEKKSIEQQLTGWKNLLDDAVERFNSDLETDIIELGTYVETNKNVIGEEYVTEIEKYAELLRKFGEAFTRFIAELKKHFDHSSSLHN